MSHARRQIRDQVVTLLRAVVGERVLVNPHETIADDQLPAYVVTTPDETISSDGPMNRRERILTVVVECLGIGADEIDDLAVSVETTLDDPTLGNLVADWALQSTVCAFQRDQARQNGSARMTFICRYMTSTDDPTVIV